MSHSTDPLRTHLVNLLAWHEAHVDFEAAIEGIPPDKRGATAPGLPHSPWQILEHLRIALEDIHDFCVNPGYKDMAWPDDYWPGTAPPTDAAWDASVAAYRRGIQAMQQLVRDQADLFAPIPHGTDPKQTYLRSVFLVADHAAYHVGQLVAVRRLLGLWP
jgi:hypothetical protein